MLSERSSRLSGEGKKKKSDSNTRRRWTLESSRSVCPNVHARPSINKYKRTGFASPRHGISNSSLVMKHIHPTLSYGIQLIVFVCLHRYQRDMPGNSKSENELKKTHPIQYELRNSIDIIYSRAGVGTRQERACVFVCESGEWAKCSVFWKNLPFFLCVVFHNKNRTSCFLALNAPR